ncbi:peptidase T [Entomospira entomophila]|uniref:Peptidase T n=1 Tax=Entomospira entomophila TaxID=2719988 RepID=A0A968GBX0_9SPIO|nr:peptidase T [Entomospira entomophilus]NIZ40541.1 peptidase T [Entomospira entomophilus]WDI36099.1 peptidase T [Entomospira entomophilus]
MKNFQQSLIDRFVRYAKIDTPVNVHMAGKQRPTNPAQLTLSRLLVTELEGMNIPVFSNEEGFVIGKIPARGKGASLDPIAFMAHIDVADAAPNTNIQPQVIPSYDGKPITLADDITIDHPELQQYIGTPIITSDGTTLLGADDKAGIAIIMTLVEYLVHHPEQDHGAFEVVFTPDEEGGDGMSGFPIDHLEAKYAYTLDGGSIGGVTYECYNAYTASVTLTGVSYHPGDARGRMVNPISMAAAFINLLPRNESPEATDGYFGCYWPDDIQSHGENVTLKVHIRDHDNTIALRRIDALHAYAKAVEASFPNGKVSVEIHEAYRNMREEIDKMPVVMQRVYDAMQIVGITPIIYPTRGGTDGARLTQMGRPCPNLFTGAHNIHARSEWLAIDAAYKALHILIEMVKS